MFGGCPYHTPAGEPWSGSVNETPVILVKGGDGSGFGHVMGLFHLKHCDEMISYSYDY